MFFTLIDYSLVAIAIRGGLGGGGGNHSLPREWFYNSFRTDHYYHQALCYVNQCLCISKHISSAAFYTVTLTIWDEVIKWGVVLIKWAWPKIFAYASRAFVLTNPLF